MKKFGTLLLSAAVAAGLGFGASVVPEQAQARSAIAVPAAQPDDQAHWKL